MSYFLASDGLIKLLQCKMEVLNIVSVILERFYKSQKGEILKLAIVTLLMAIQTTAMFLHPQCCIFVLSFCCRL